MILFVVRAVPGGWMVTSSAETMPLMFLSGARAEAKARDLALLESRLGRFARVSVFLADGALAGGRLYAPVGAAA